MWSEHCAREEIWKETEISMHKHMHNHNMDTHTDTNQSSCQEYF